MKKNIILLVLLLTGCNINGTSTNSSLNSTSSSSEKNYAYQDFAYIHHFENDYCQEYFTDGKISTFSSLGVGNAEIGPIEYIDFKDYGITNFVGGDSISLSYEGGMWVSAILGGYAVVEKLYDIEYYPSDIYEVNLTKEIIEEDQVHIGFSSTLEDLDIENDYVISKDEKGNIVQKKLDEYENNTTLYYSFNTKMSNPHKYSYLYDYKIR